MTIKKLLVSAALVLPLALLSCGGEPPIAQDDPAAAEIRRTPAFEATTAVARSPDVGRASVERSFPESLPWPVGSRGCPKGIKPCSAQQVGQPCDPNNLNVLCSAQANGHYCCLAYAP